MSPTILTDKIEATRLADALRRSFPTYGDGTRSDRERLAIDAAAMLESWPDGEPVASMIRHRAGTPASRAWDGKVHWHEWSEWSPATLAHGRAVTDPSRNPTEDSEWQMQPLYAAQPDQSARIADRKWLDSECLDGGCQSLKWRERIAALEAELARATGEGRSLAAALDAARNGILWYHDTYPDSVNDSDHDALRQIDAALQGHVATESERIAALEADRAAALRLANDLTLETQTVEEAVADLVRMVRDARTRIAALEASLAERDRVIEQARVALEGLLRGCKRSTIQGLTGWHEKSMPSSEALDAGQDALRAIEEVRRG